MEVEIFQSILRRSKIISICLSIIVRILMLHENISTVLFHKLFKSINPRKRSTKNIRRVQTTLIKMILKVFKKPLNSMFIIHYSMIKFLYWSNLKQQSEEEQTQLITRMELLRNSFDKSFPLTFFLQFTPQEKKFKLWEVKIHPDMIKHLKWISCRFLFKLVLIRMPFLQGRFLSDNKKLKSRIISSNRLIKENSFNDQSQVLTSFQMKIKSQSSESKTKLLNCKIQTCFNCFSK